MNYSSIKKNVDRRKLVKNNYLAQKREVRSYEQIFLR
jgi:hypothetical protein